MRREHGLQPTRSQDEVIVKQHEEATLGHGSSAIVGTGITEIALVQHHAKRWAKRCQPRARAISTAVVD